MSLDVISYSLAKKMVKHAARHEREAIDPIKGVIGDFDKITFGNKPNISLRYDDVNDFYHLRDEVNAVDLMKLIVNKPIEFDIIIPVILEDPKENLDADHIGRQYRSGRLIPQFLNYAGDVAIEASWHPSESDSIVKIALYDENDDVDICSVSGNWGHDEKSAYKPFVLGHKHRVTVYITQASGTSGANVDVSKAILYHKIKIG